MTISDKYGIMKLPAYTEPLTRGDHARLFVCFAQRNRIAVRAIRAKNAENFVRKHEV